MENNCGYHLFESDSEDDEEEEQETKEEEKAVLKKKTAFQVRMTRPTGMGLHSIKQLPTTNHTHEVIF